MGGAVTVQAVSVNLVHNVDCAVAVNEAIGVNGAALVKRASEGVTIDWRVGALR
jgi:hypothetical protein